MSRGDDNPKPEQRPAPSYWSDAHHSVSSGQSAVASPGLPPGAPPPELPEVEHIGSGYVRFIIGLVWLWSAWRRVDSPLLFWVAALFLVYAIIVFVLLIRKVPSKRRVFICSTIDVLAITVAAYFYGSITTLLVLLYAPMIAVHAVNRARNFGPKVLWLSLGGWGLVVALEAAGVLPAQPGGPGSYGGGSDLLFALLASWPIPISMAGVYVILAPQVERIQVFLQKERQLVESEMTAHVRARKLQQKLIEAQRLESLGRLAGGVAHDFNNLLTAILGLSNLVYEDLPDDERRKDMSDVIHAAERAAELTSQLLAFSRRQLIEPRSVDVNELLGRLEKMLRRIIGEDIVFDVTLGDDAGVIYADPTQVEQVFVNLVVNARDAMPEGGELSIETAFVNVTEETALDIGALEPGDYSVITVSDSGVGMDEETRSRIFDPFFSTKEAGKGTGLGLATVYGIVTQNDGAIVVETAPGSGTSFKVFWPCAAEESLERFDGRVESPRGRETILLVEDEEIVRSLTTRLLEGAGYRVLPCADANEALETVETIGTRIHMLLTDVVIPQMSGKALADRIGELEPEIRVVFMSGYSDETITTHGVQSDDATFIAKPFTAETLLSKVREEFDRDE